jgi:hypothetical protein
LKIKNLREFDDRKVMVIFLRMISSLVILIGMMIVCVITSAKNEVLMTTLQIIDYFKIPDASFLWIAQGIPGASSMLVATEILWMDNFILLIAAVIVGAPFAVGMFQMMEDFSDPPKAIQRLEERINALRAKST